MFCVTVLGLFTLVPAILMQYTMVMHLAQTYEKRVVNEAVAAAKALPNGAKKSTAAKRGGAVPGGGGEGHAHGERPPLRERLARLCTRDGFYEFANANSTMHFFLMLLLVDFFISVTASVVRQDQADYCVQHCIALCFDDAATAHGMPRGLPRAVEAAMTACLGAGLNTTDADLDVSMLAFGRTAHLLETTDLVLAYCFVVDVLLRLTPDPHAFLTSPWDVFDAVVVIGYAVVAPLLVSGNSSGLLLLRVMRVLRFHRFVYAMSASGAGLTGGPSRRERLVMCCQRVIACARRRDGYDDAATAGIDFAPPPRGKGDLGDDPITAMKAKRAADREARTFGGEVTGGGSTPLRSSNSKTADKVVSSAELAHCSA